MKDRGNVCVEGQLKDQGDVCVQVAEFFKGKELGSGSMALKQSLETVQTHIDWTARFGENITAWFNTNVRNSL